MSEIEKKLMEMKTGDQTNSKELGLTPGLAFWITRVPGGWIYTIQAGSCFVPGGLPGPVVKEQQISFTTPGDPAEQQPQPKKTRSRSKKKEV